MELKSTQKTGIIYYSGDTRETTQIEDFIKSKATIDKIYVDVTSVKFPGNEHLHVRELAKVIPAELKDRVYCMHFNNNICIGLAKKLGFQVVEVYENES